MSLFQITPSQARLLWVEPHRLVAQGQTRPCEGLPSEDQLAQALSLLPTGATKWVVDDLWTPGTILRDIVEVPSGGEPREQFFRWKYTQSLALEAPQSVQTLSLGEAAWLCLGMPTELRDRWVALATRLNRPIHALVPRWLWLYNRLAPTQDLPGLLLSLCPHSEGGYTGSLVAWSRQLTLLRQWADPADEATWMHDRVQPSASYLGREGRGPRDLWVWGAASWPEGELNTRTLQAQLPLQEAL